MEPKLGNWSENQQILRAALAKPAEHPEAIDLFLRQHAPLHSAAVWRDEEGQAQSYSYEDELWQGLPDEAARRVPAGEEHSIAWCIWHLTRIEDITMNLLLAGAPQLFTSADWEARLAASARDTGNAMNPEEIARLSAELNIDALKAYRVAVGRRTREIVRRAAPASLKTKVAPERLAQALAEGAVVPAAQGLLDYWGGLTLAGLLLMPPTRHNLVHLNEAHKLKRKALAGK